MFQFSVMKRSPELFIRGAVCSKTQDSLLYIKRCSIYYIDSLFIISTADLLYRQRIYYIDSRYIISTVDLLYRQSIYYIDSRFIISTVDLLYRQSIYNYIDNAELFQHVLMRMRMRILVMLQSCVSCAVGFWVSV